MAKQINFEVQVMQGGRWTIHARFPSTGREEAIDEAKQVGGLGAVRVLRDVYDNDSGTSAEFTIYKYDGKNSAIHGSSGGSDHGRGGENDHDDDQSGDHDDWMRGGDDDWESGGSDDDWMRGDDDDDEKSVKKKQRKQKKNDGEKSTSFSGLIVKLLFIILLSIGLAATIVTVMSYYIEGINFFGTILTGVAKENALIMTFLVTFIATAITLSSVLLGNTNLKERQRQARAGRFARRQAAQRSSRVAGNSAPVASVATDQSAQSTMEQSLPAIPQDIPPVPHDAETSEFSPMSESEGMEQFREAAADGSFTRDISEENESIEQGGQENDTQKRGVVLDAGDFPMLETNVEVTLSPHAEKQKKYMMQFIDKALVAIGKDAKAMSNFDKFGISLFLAGACETLGQKHELDEKDLAKIMADSVQTMGFKRSHAKTFADKYVEYLVQDPTYMQMFQAGRNSLATYLTDESRIEKNMVSSMAEWNKPKVKESEAGPVTVLFTDISGSTAMTQNLGDAGAQHVVRAHNRVVREALTMWNGKEVKHTGDGIMASFVKTSDSLDASMQMQRETAEYTEQNPDKPLHLKIGINAGEPISEDNDLFGSTVQMSARIVDKAQADEIFVSEIVRGICAGKNYKFVNRGTYPMKGFDTDPVLYEVIWKE